MGVGFSSLYICGSSSIDRAHKRTIVDNEAAIGHSFCYVPTISSSVPQSPTPIKQYHRCNHRQWSSSSFMSISGASVSANATSSGNCTLQSSPSFSTLPLQPSSSSSAACSNSDGGYFLSRPIEHGAPSWNDFADDDVNSEVVHFSGPIIGSRGVADGKKISQKSVGRSRFGDSLQLRRSMSERSRRPSVFPVRSAGRKHGLDRTMVAGVGANGSTQWAHGKAGEDRVHVVVSEEHLWLFIGIYDGFNGPDAPEFLVHNLYRCVSSQLEGLSLEGKKEPTLGKAIAGKDDTERMDYRSDLKTGDGKFSRSNVKKLEITHTDRSMWSLSKMRNGFGSLHKGSNRMWTEQQETVVKRVTVEGLCQGRLETCGIKNHELVLEALSQALEITECEYLDMTDGAMGQRPELALMGSCVLVVLMRDEDIYVMNLGDSRALVAQSIYQQVAAETTKESSSDAGLDFAEGIVEQVNKPVGESNGSVLHSSKMKLEALQLTIDHSTSNLEEVQRIKEEHPEDTHCIINNRIKGRLKVTRAFGVGYLKKPKWNNGLLKMFQHEYVGNAPYISSSPSLFHHKLGPNDRFLVISSDGLFEYLTNEEVVSHVGSYMEQFPDGDPAQSLIQELLLRAARSAGLNLYELLDIPQGARRKFHDDVTVMVISLEGRIWKSYG